MTESIYQIINKYYLFFMLSSSICINVILQFNRNNLIKSNTNKIERPTS